MILKMIYIILDIKFLGEKYYVIKRVQKIGVGGEPHC